MPRLFDDYEEIQAISRELFVLRRTGSGWRIVDYMFNQSERAGS